MYGVPSIPQSQKGFPATLPYQFMPDLLFFPQIF